MPTSVPPATRGLIIANVVMFILQYLTHNAYTGLFALWPPGPNFHAWQLVTYAFLHGGVLHILVNMYALWIFGPMVELFLGAASYLSLYFASLLAAAGVQMLSLHLAGMTEETIGASGGIFGLLLAFGWYFPKQRLILLFPPIPIPAWLFVTLYGALELALGVTGTESGVAHFAHLGGMLGAALVILFWRARDGDRRHW